MKYSIAVAPWAFEMAPVLYRGELHSLVDQAKAAVYKTSQKSPLGCTSGYFPYEH